MQSEGHGLSIGIERTGDHFFLLLVARGRLTHADYDVITPLIDSAMAGVKHPKISALVDAIELEGWSARAAWDDFKLGLKYGNAFEKIAIYGNSDGQEWASRIANWFTSGEVRFFEQRDIAVRWLQDA